MSLIKALSHISDVGRRYTLALAGGAGNQDEFGEIQRLAAESVCEVSFLGRLSHQELAREMNLSDVFVLPSFYEGLPLVIIEAMACGLQVVCTDLPGIQPWIDDKLPEHGIKFVKPPRMKNADEPLEEDLVDFEVRLAEAIEGVKNENLPDQEAVKKLSWDGVCASCMSIVLRDIM